MQSMTSIMSTIILLNILRSELTVIIYKKQSVFSTELLAFFPVHRIMNTSTLKVPIYIIIKYYMHIDSTIVNSFSPIIIMTQQ